RDVVLPAVVHGQTVELVHLDIAVVLGDLAHHLHTLVHRKQALLGDVDQHPHHDLVIEVGGTADDVEMPVGYRVERPGTQDTAHNHFPALDQSRPPVPTRGDLRRRPYQTGSPRLATGIPVVRGTDLNWASIRWIGHTRRSPRHSGDPAQGHIPTASAAPG